MKIIIISIVIAFLSMIVKHYKPEYALITQLTGVIILALYAVSFVESIISTLNTMISSSGLDISFLEILLKALGISVLTDISSSVCRDSGNNTLSNAVDLFGKTLIVILALPMLKLLAESAIGFIN